MSQAYWDNRYFAADFWSDYYWEFELPSVTGTIAVTLADDACAFVGNFSEDFNSGAIAVTLDNTAAAFTGAFDIVSPAEGYFHPSYWHRDFFDSRYWANVPGSESEGTIAITFDETVGAIVGESFDVGVITGTIAATLDDVEGVFEASQASFINFDLDVAIGVNWAVLDLTIEEGGIVAALDDVTSQFTGSFQVADQINGLIAVQLEDGQWEAEGTVVNPGSFVGIAATQLDDVAGLVLGNVFAPADWRGEIHVTLADTAAAFAGAVVNPVFAGTIAVQLEDVAIDNFNGVFVPAGAILGTIAAQLDDVEAELEGAYSVDVKTGTLAVELDETVAAIAGIFVADGGLIGRVEAVLGDVEAVMSGSYTNPTIAQPITTPVTVRSIDWKTLTDQYNAGQPDLETIEYEFSGGRVFRRTGT